MAFAVRYRNQFKDLNGYQYQIDVFEDGYIGAVTSFKTATPGFELTYDGDGTSFFELPIQTSRTTIYWMVQNGTDKAFVESVAAAPDGKFMVMIYRTPPGGAQTKFWSGIIQNDGIELALDYYPQTVQLTATCGLARLRNITFDYATDALTSDELIMGDVLLRALNYNRTSELYSVGENFLASAVDWWDRDHDTTFADPIAQCKIRRASLITNFDVFDGESTWKAKTCFEVIEQMMISFGATIRMSSGVWFISQPNNYTTGANIDWYYYDKISTFANLISITARNPVQQLSKVARPTNMAGGTYTFRPSIEKAIARTTNQRLITLLNKSASSGSTTFNLGSSISNVASLAMRIRGTFEVNVGYAENRITISIDHSTYTIVTDKTNDGWKWENTSGIVYTVDKHKPVFNFYPSGPFTKKSAPEKLKINLDIVIPKLYAAQTNDITIAMNCQGRGVYSASGTLSGAATGTWTNQSWSFQGSIMQQTNTGDDAVFETKSDDVAYYSGNSNNSIEQVLEPRYSSFGAYSVGGLKIWDGTALAWEQSNSWKKGTPGTGIDLHKLLAQECAALRETGRKVLRTTIFGNMESWHSLQSSSVYYMFVAGTFKASDAQWSGEWIEIGYANTGTQLTTSGSTNTNIDPIEVINTRVSDLRANMSLVAMSQNIPQMITDAMLNNSDTAPNTTPVDGQRYFLSVVYDATAEEFNIDARDASQMVVSSRNVSIDCGTFDSGGRAVQIRIDCGTF